jgi:RNA polymerase sigma factor (sigma-70 family)
MASQEQPSPVSADIVTLIPALRAFAWSLTRRHEDADDLVQETLTKAIANIDRFQPGTNLRAWLMTIMRNTFYNQARKAARERTGSADCVSGTVSVQPTQEWRVQENEVMAAVMRLPEHYREMLILVVMVGESYESAAKICGVALGTVKSRVNRARSMVSAEIQREPEIRRGHRPSRASPPA